MKAIIIPITLLLIIGIIACSKKTTEPNNIITIQDTVSTPVFSIEAGTYIDSVLVSISCTTPGAVIKYTINGTIPDTSSVTYITPILVDSTLTIKARAYKTGWIPSPIASASYIISTIPLEEIRVIANITASVDTIYADNGLTYSNISVTVKDGNNLPVEGQLVQFTSSLGHMTTNVPTNNIGLAQSVFWDEGVIGLATIRAIVRNYSMDNPDSLLSSDSAFVRVAIIGIPPVSTVHSIQFTQTGQIDLNAINTGGCDSAILHVKLYDESGDLVIAPHNVWFKISSPSPPEGANLNNQPAGDSVLVVSENGVAHITVYSGTASGFFGVRASCISGGNYLFDVQPRIFIHAAPPSRIEVFAGGYNTGENMGGGLWRIVIGAIVYDVYNNPLDYGTSVWFYLPEETYNSQIGANAYVGNESVNGDSTAGVAYTTLTYSGYYTFESLKIRAVTGGVNGMEVFGEGYIVLPLNQPQLELEIIPGNMIFHGNTNTVPPSATALLNAWVFDGQGCSIHKRRISLTSSAGEFEPIHGTSEDPMNCNPYAQPNIIVTDWYDPVAIYDWYYDPIWQIPGGPDINDGQDGLAQGQIRFYAWEIPWDDPIPNYPSTLSVAITAELLGTGVTTSVTIILTKYCS